MQVDTKESRKQQDILFIDYSSVFNTIIRSVLINKLQNLGLCTSLCNWILDFLIGRPQSGRIGNNISSLQTINTGPLLYSLYTHDCVARHSSSAIYNFANDTTVVGRISDGDEEAYRSEIDWLVEWCHNNNLALNVSKTKELTVDFRKGKSGEHTPVLIERSTVERASSFKFLGVNISEDLSWAQHIDTITKEAQQRLYFIRSLRRFGMSPKTLANFYRCAVESILTGCITVWYGGSIVQDRKRLQSVVDSATPSRAQPSPPSRTSSQEGGIHH
ncbi:uncharacterized protein LOC127578465 isoform X2 [Pristis pectinata]|uniref:uncharacterized protein LOC127578465 isoform X2 n=1 Tax=Pristis pectinata TaxID=685728 RepID=UPI00223E2A30|nr:uncharacterized protein LOC127578465 isoform X2 [Pristis pectinata]XP_051886492.1 uncharacterized protein LOC127578465 isoform X2 [Pristis pectinata]